MCWWLCWRDVKVWKCEWLACITLWPGGPAVFRNGREWGKDGKKSRLLQKPYSRDIREDWVKDGWDIFFDICSGLCLSRGDKFREWCASRKQRSPALNDSEEMFWCETKSGTWGRGRWDVMSQQWPRELWHGFVGDKRGIGKRNWCCLNKLDLWLTVPGESAREA